MYFIKSGIVKVLSSDNRTIIAYMSEGTYFGEIGILLTSKRTCSIQATTNSIFFTISKEDLVAILEQFPL
jgi:CRP-like cAMP-binding protein